MATDRAQVCWLCGYLSIAEGHLPTASYSPELWKSGTHAPVDSFGLAVGRDFSMGRVEEFLAAGEAGDPHTKPFFFPVASAATCTDSHLEVDQSVDTTWASVDTLSQISPEGVLGRSLVSTLPDLVSTLPDQFCPKSVLEGL
ncbi:hypothetical protein Taro_000145 [Colocasia esculenta]|uniref:Uncharacterized protein n=1 Tax=Colocasia esculenta TaxID=4460 RepID=A0A843TE61_COLES|nr:hypothetical protein [Colocasia esculenta]